MGIISALTGTIPKISAARRTFGLLLMDNAASSI